MVKMVAKDFVIRRDITGRVFVDVTSAKRGKFEFEISQAALPKMRSHLAEALNLPRPPDTPRGFEVPPIAVQNVHVTSHPDLGAIFLRFDTSNGTGIEIPLMISEATALVGGMCQILGMTTAPRDTPNQSSDTEAQILSFQCECDLDERLVFLQFQAANRTPTKIKLDIARAEQVFESVGNALKAIKTTAPILKQ